MTPSCDIGDDVGSPEYHVKPNRREISTRTQTTLAQDPPDPLPLYVDQLIEDHRVPGRTRYLETIVTHHDSYIGSASIGYFSESRIRALTNRLGHTGVECLLNRISAVVSDRYERHHEQPATDKLWQKPESLPEVDGTTMRLYVSSYFSQLHPVYPFLDRSKFEQRISNVSLAADLAGDIHWSALYHTVLALGCQYHGGGAFEPGKGKSWKFYQVALGFASDIFVGAECMGGLQAITAMAIFALNFSYMHLDSLFIKQAACVAQRMRLNASSDAADQHFRYRTFWVIYFLEKTLSFHHGNTSVIMDSDIGCPVPITPESVFGDYNWLTACAGLARFLSRAYESLFSISATWNTEASYYRKIDTMNSVLERWRQSIPMIFRPGEPFRAQSFHGSCETFIALQTHFYYHNACIALCRLTLHLGRHSDGPRQVAARKAIMQAARSIIELLRHIDMEAYTPVYILAHLPLSALFILFDLVIHNPTHPETASNLALLEVAGGHFSRLEYATGGSLPSSVLAEFAYIARTFVRTYRVEGNDGSTIAVPTNVNIDLPRRQDDSLPSAASFLENETHDHQPPLASPDTLPLFFPAIDDMDAGDGSLTGTQKLVPVPVPSEILRETLKRFCYRFLLQLGSTTMKTCPFQAPDLSLPMIEDYLHKGCHALVKGVNPAYGYQPSLAAGIVFCVLFGTSMVAHTAQSFWSRKWWCLLFAIGCLTEVLGWAARTWSAECPYQTDAFLMQISTLIIGPTFFTAGIYVLLGQLIALLGPESSILRPSWYLWIFCTCDIVSLVVQAVGGGMASSAASEVDGDTAPGTNTMVAGIVFQMAAITAFAFCGIDFLVRCRRPQLRARFTPRMRLLVLATTFSVVCIYVRSIYRTIELLEGWSGYLITREWFFIGLDGIPMVLAVVVFNIFHPYWLLPREKEARKAESWVSLTRPGENDDI
ncbi:RTA-like protein [Aspergillus oryzae]|uniref:RTA-like protein n=2 Tax=Aspergillus subgen. Circumdati TaxID=2720871 RepID=A0A1S9DK18_ASPOZ|nr:RTA-like protein [Aspergillus oryzae]